MKPEKKVCQNCGREFMQTHYMQKLCSDECKKEHRKKYNREQVQKRKAERQARRTARKCSECGRVFFPQRANTNTCSPKCSNARSKRLQRQRQAAYNEETYKSATVKAGKPKRKIKTLKEITAAAAKEHLTYGQYVLKYGL